MVRFIGIFLLVFLSSSYLQSQNIRWSPKQDILMTPWGEKINPDAVLVEYPRPTMKREEWKNLNGLWSFTIVDKNNPKPERYDYEILVPFAVESALSGIGKRITENDMLWYKRRFFIPESWSGKPIVLHIGASDWETTIFINGKEAAKHRGGYDPIQLDITPLLREKGHQEIEISVWDPTDAHYQPVGKQKKEPKGIWYTPVSGIWQTVWIEPVGKGYFHSIKKTPDIDQKKLKIQANVRNANEGDSILAVVRISAQEVTRKAFPYDVQGSITISDPKLWWPEKPFLYDLDLYLVRHGMTVDKIESYFGMRKIAVEKDDNNIERLFLNNYPYFQLGLLDQGWWPDGLYTAPSDEALVFDIIQAKKMGYNLLRKHVKVEPERWYYHCDRLGMLVWQDMPNGDKKAEWKGPSGIDGKEMERSFASAEQYKIELKSMIDARYNHPCIIMWVPFNEGWGQFNTVEITNLVTQYDPSRLVSGPSGGNYFPVGHTKDHHQYPGPGMPQADPGRALVLSEFGGLGLAVKGNLWQGDGWGYKSYDKKRKYERAYIALYDSLPYFIEKGLSAAIYTQLSDVETEVNGILTYNRKVLKLRPKKAKPLHSQFTGIMRK